MDIKEIEYSELRSTSFKNFKVGLKITTNNENYEKDFIMLVSEVKEKLNEIINMDKKKTRKK